MVKVSPLCCNAFCHQYIISNEILASKGTINRVNELLDCQLFRIIETNQVRQILDLLIKLFNETSDKILQPTVFKFYISHLNSNFKIFSINYTMKTFFSLLYHHLHPLINSTLFRYISLKNSENSIKSTRLKYQSYLKKELISL